MYEILTYESTGSEWDSFLPTIDIVPYEELGKLIYKRLTNFTSSRISIKVEWMN